jgi:hypothetical protein
MRYVVFLPLMDRCIVINNMNSLYGAVLNNLNEVYFDELKQN